MAKRPTQLAELQTQLFGRSRPSLEKILYQVIRKEKNSRLSEIRFDFRPDLRGQLIDFPFIHQKPWVEEGFTDLRSRTTHSNITRELQINNISEIKRRTQGLFSGKQKPPADKNRATLCLCYWSVSSTRVLE